MTPAILTSVAMVAGVYACVGALAHIAARLGLHRKIVPVRDRDLSSLRIWGRANPWRIELHSGLTDAQRRHVAEHEWQHVRDKWLLGLFGFALWRLARRRSAVLWLESRAYARSVEHGRPMHDCAAVLAGELYDLGVTRNEAHAAIERWVR